MHSSSTKDSTDVVRTKDLLSAYILKPCKHGRSAWFDKGALEGFVDEWFAVCLEERRCPHAGLL